MLANYTKRRSTQRSSSANAVSSNQAGPPFSPQFGGNEDGGNGRGSAGAADDGEQGNTSARSSNGVTPFDERVKSVRSRIREMVAVAGEDSSDGSEMFDSYTPSSKPVRGSKATRSRASASAASAVTNEASADAPKKQTPSERKPSKSKPSASVPKTSEEALGQAVGSTLGGNSASSSPRLQGGGPAARASAAAASRQRSLSPALEPDTSGQQVVGQDGDAYVGARVCLLDPRIARYVEASGTIVEVRCNGERVRVEHDGADKAQRYYNTGKNGEHQLSFESAAAPATAPAVTPSNTPTSTPRRASRRLPEAPPIVADSSSSGSDSPGPSAAPAKPVAKKAAAKKGAARAGSIVTRRSFSEPPEIAPDTQPDIAEAKVATKKSRYSQLRQARQSGSMPVAAELPPAPVAATPATSEAELPNKISYSQRRSLRMQQAQGATDTEVTVAASAKIADTAGPAEKARGRGSASAKADTGMGENVGAKGSVNHEFDADLALKEKPRDDADAHGSEIERFRQEHEALLSRLRHLEQTFVRDLGAVKDDVHLQIQTTEKRIFTRVLEEVDKQIRQTLGTASGKLAYVDAAKLHSGKLATEASPSSETQGVGTPLNEEPEPDGEYDTCEMSEGSSIQASGSRRGSQRALSPPTDESPAPKSGVFSSAELADSTRRLQNIGNAARSITSGLGGSSSEPTPATTNPTCDYPPATLRQSYIHPAATLDYGGLQTPDFASAAFADSPLHMAVPGTAPSAAPPDGLDAEMARLGDLRRFAASVLAAAESQCQQAVPNSAATAPPAWTDSANGGRMSASMHSTESRPSFLRDAANHQEQEYQDSPLSMFGNSGSSRRSASVPGHAQAPCPPWEDSSRCSTPRSHKLSAQPPPQPPPAQAGARPSHQWPSEPRGQGSGSAFHNGAGRRRSSAQPLQVPWPAAGSKSEWEGSVKNEGRLVF